MKRHKLQKSRIRNKKDYKGILQTIDANNLDNLDEIEKFLETQKLPKLTSEGIEYLSTKTLN